jgi:hypothetical protein
MVTHDAPDTADQEHPPLVVTATLPVPAVSGNAWAVGETL